MLFSRERFPVSVNPSQASERVGLRGDYQLVILGHSVGLLRPGAPEPFLVWPVTCIRQYKHELLLGNAKSARSTTLVTIEVGRYVLVKPINQSVSQSNVSFSFPPS